jgi:hypothetical protein
LVLLGPGFRNWTTLPARVADQVFPGGCVIGAGATAPCGKVNPAGKVAFAEPSDWVLLARFVIVTVKLAVEPPFALPGEIDAE